MPTEEQTYRAGVLDKLSDLKEVVEGIDTKVTYTNGKVRKLIIALTALGGIVLGQLFTSKEIISLLIHTV